MPLPVAPLVAVAAALIGSAVLARMIRKEWQRVNAKLEAYTARTRDESERDQLPKLKQDPKTGIYSADQQ
jgi:hypothetical protein